MEGVVKQVEEVMVKGMGESKSFCRERELPPIGF